MPELVLMDWNQAQPIINPYSL